MSGMPFASSASLEAGMSCASSSVRGVEDELGSVTCEPVALVVEPERSRKGGVGRSNRELASVVVTLVVGVTTTDDGFEMDAASRAVCGGTGDERMGLRPAAWSMAMDEPRGGTMTGGGMLTAR